MSSPPAPHPQHKWVRPPFSHPLRPSRFATVPSCPSNWGIHPGDGVQPAVSPAWPVGSCTVASAAAFSCTHWGKWSPECYLARGCDKACAANRPFSHFRRRVDHRTLFQSASYAGVRTTWRATPVEPFQRPKAVARAELNTQTCRHLGGPNWECRYIGIRVSVPGLSLPRLERLKCSTWNTVGSPTSLVGLGSSGPIVSALVHRGELIHSYVTDATTIDAVEDECLFAPPVSFLLPRCRALR